MTALALCIILVLAGVYILVKGGIKFSETKVLERPQSIYLGVAIILEGLSLFIYDMRSVIGAVVVTIVVAALGGKQEATAPVQSDNKSVLYLGIFFVFAMIIAALFYFVTN